MDYMKIDVSMVKKSAQRKRERGRENSTYWRLKEKLKSFHDRSACLAIKSGIIFRRDHIDVEDR
jgi:hypothetical protein